MFRWVRNKYELFKLDSKEKSLDQEWQRKKEESARAKDESILEEWENNYGDRVYGDLRWTRRRTVSAALLREADELLIPRPSFADKTNWEAEEDEYGMPREGLVLNPEAMTELRASIRKEKKEGREVIEWWVKLFGGLVTLLTGLAGALIGLASVWKHK